MILLAFLLLQSPEILAQRNLAQRAAFVRTHPCPATGKSRGACPGWVVDHVIPLCAGGLDAPENMAWQRYSPDSLIKDRWEKAYCKGLKKP